MSEKLVFDRLKVLSGDVRCEATVSQFSDCSILFLAFRSEPFSFIYIKIGMHQTQMLYISNLVSGVPYDGMNREHTVVILHVGGKVI